ncbi:MAG: MFS transporter [Gemmatimonadetes bacterium]|nr:MAG: MFS transporter [Gemmatimonadota bacterium]PYO67023.1 MAG: MFS transporter [Gemmatimonadota bacterium]PYO85170.1 MAG: MFS transporter [Gemmatimonadota bacterium]PYP64936.1 MAG: MFS transporter [Gemmatimonadota bacterium]
MAPWFSASAVAPALTAAWRLRPGGAAWLTISVQLGFVAGALVSAALTLSDRWSARRLAAAASLGAAVATLAVAFSRGPAVGIAARVATGAALAGVYPPGMKIAAGWFRDGRGWAIGMLVGALTVGSAAPHLMRWLVPAEAWRLVLVAAAVSALLGAALMLRVPSDGPYAAPSPPFSWTAAPRILRDRAVLLANAGYLGHMWELYAMWTWTASFVAASETVRRGAAEDVRGVAALITFCVVGIGAMGCWLGGRYADRLGRTTVTSAAMAASGACALAVGVAYGRPLWVLVPLLVVWGVAVIADSAQFSAAVSELAPAAYVGTALTLQTSLGFLLTVATIYLVPQAARVLGWRWSMSILAVGPALGVWAMQALKRRPEALRMAGGRR